ncbi:hypothetical protein RUM43_008567 [Polyplax serrata]|uniref:Uncharacterized protein n=1 Tax=Polyplax serrata TaxID=468196 RepID=A0AAN8PV60_POLSC
MLALDSDFSDGSNNSKSPNFNVKNTSELDIRDLSMTASYNSAARFSFSSTWLSLISLILIYR